MYSYQWQSVINEQLQLRLIATRFTAQKKKGKRSAVLNYISGLKA